MLADLEPQEKRLLKTNKHLTVVNFENKGGAIMPILVSTPLQKRKEGVSQNPSRNLEEKSRGCQQAIRDSLPRGEVLIDPTEQTADANQENNVWPPQIKEEFFTLERKKQGL